MSMFAALSEKCEFYRDKINLFIALAPVATCHEAGAKKLQQIKDNETLVNLVQKKMGHELFPRPQADGKITSNLMKMTGLDKFGI